MQRVDKVIYGYATSATPTSNNIRSWTNQANITDWSDSVSPDSTATNAWRNTSDTLQYTAKMEKFLTIDQIKTFKSNVDSNWNNAFNGTGTTYTNFSCVPDTNELTGITFLDKVSCASRHTEWIKLLKNGVSVANTNNGFFGYRYGGTGDGTENINTLSDLYSDFPTKYNGQVGLIFEKCSDGKFYRNGDMTDTCIGEWTTSDFKNGLFSAQAYGSTTATGTYKTLHYGYSVKLTFSEFKYVLTVNAGAEGTATGGGLYDKGKQVTLTATPNDNKTYKFARWSDGNTQNPRTITVSEDATYTAIFEKIKYTITGNVAEGQGSVSGAGTFDVGSTIELTANPTLGWVFARWSDGNKDNPRTITVTANKTYSAVFEEAPPPEFTSASLLYNSKQVSKTNKVPASQDFILSVTLKQ